MRGSSSTTDGFWVAELTDVAPGGKSTQITAGWLQMSRRALDQSRSIRGNDGDLAVPFHPFTKASVLPVTPGKDESLDIEIFNTNAIVKPGHRLRLVLRSSDIPHAIPGIPDLLPTLLGAQTVHLTKSDPSYVSIPFVDRSLSAAKCLARTAGVSGRGIGGVRLGGSLRALENRARVVKRAGATVRFCVTGGGRFLVRSKSGKITFIASTAPRHKTKAVAAGKRMRHAASGFRRAKGGGFYMTARANPGRVLYGVRSGKARYLAVVKKSSAANTRALRRTLKRLGLR
jgi:hypothetical protein